MNWNQVQDGQYCYPSVRMVCQKAFRDESDRFVVLKVFDCRPCPLVTKSALEVLRILAMYGMYFDCHDGPIPSEGTMGQYDSVKVVAIYLVRARLMLMCGPSCEEIQSALLL